MNASQFVNTKGAARHLGCTETWIHKLVANGKLKAYVYDENGVLVEHMPDERRRGQGLYFLIKDLDVYQPNVSRRPRGSKNKSSAEQKTMSHPEA
ncbi:MAG TPA: hypothetical protein VFN35_20950 [Ktedonobacteraceae bacterium]|nr:hypothetical protein [Ktedonobacteraceae bacterium]